MRSAYDAATELCPYCNTECEAEYTDVGVGLVQTSPFMCESCHSIQIGPYDIHDKPLTAREQETGWYEPTIEEEKET